MCGSHFLNPAESIGPLRRRMHALSRSSPSPLTWPQKKPTVAASPGIDSEEAIDEAIWYVNENPKKEGKPAQKWSFVTPFAGLPTGWVTDH